MSKVSSFIRGNTMLLFLAPAVIIAFIFYYLPLVGLGIAFVDYNMFLGSGPIVAIFESEFVGMANFQELWSDPYFWQTFWNTIQISVLKIIFVFPIPILLAILINEIIFPKFKKITQTILYLPHFLSWVIVGGIFLTLLSTYGWVNSFLMNIGVISDPIPFLTNPILFIPVLLVSDAWKEVGWSAIVYLAAITSIDSQLYEAIKIDGGGKFRQIRDVTLPGIMPTIAMMFVLRVAQIMNAGFDQILNMYNPFVYETADIISTYSYRLATEGVPDYSQATAIGLFNSVIAFALMLIANKVVRKLTNRGIW